MDNCISFDELVWKVEARMLHYFPEYSGDRAMEREFVAAQIARFGEEQDVLNNMSLAQMATAVTTALECGMQDELFVDNSYAATHLGEFLRNCVSRLTD